MAFGENGVAGLWDIHRSLRAVRPKRVRYYDYETPFGTVTIEGEHVVQYCLACRRKSISEKTKDRWNRAILKKLSSKSGLLTHKELQFIFQVMPCSQSDLAEAFGRKKSTLSKYKSGENPIDPLFDYVLRWVLYEIAQHGTSESIRLLKRRIAEAKTDKPISRISVKTQSFTSLRNICAIIITILITYLVYYS